MESGVKYLSGIQQKDGRFIYRYDPVKDRKAKKRYNILRHAGALYAFYQALPKLKNSQGLSKTGERSIRYLLSNIESIPAKPPLLYIKYADGKGKKSKVKLGGAALTLLALTRYEEATGDTKYRSTMEGIARFLVFMQRSDGSFRSYLDAKTKKPLDDKSSIYYPGEAMYALMRLYKLSSDPAYLDTVTKGAHYFLQKEQGVPTEDLEHNHWLMMALAELLQVKRDEKLAKYCFRIAKSIISKQIPSQNNLPGGWIGGWQVPPGVAPTATRLEGLVAACKIKRLHGEEFNEYKKHLWLGANFLLRNQFGEDELPANALGGSKVGVGGFREGPEKNSIRIDFVQHSISALIGIYELCKP